MLDVEDVDERVYPVGKIPRVVALSQVYNHSGDVGQRRHRVVDCRAREVVGIEVFHVGHAE